LSSNGTFDCLVVVFHFLFAMFVAAFRHGANAVADKRAGVDMDTEGIVWGAVGLLNFIALIVLLRWLGTPEDQKKVPPRVRKGKERREAKKG
jgi:hypothetical protein